MADNSPPVTESPRWSALTKFLVSLITFVLIGCLITRFQEMVGPLVFSFVLAYLLSPVIRRLTERTHLKWGTAVSLVYLVLVLLLVTLLIVAGIAIEQQISGL